MLTEISIEPNDLLDYNELPNFNQYDAEPNFGELYCGETLFECEIWMMTRAYAAIIDGYVVESVDEAPYFARIYGFVAFKYVPILLEKVSLYFFTY